MGSDLIDVSQEENLKFYRQNIKEEDWLRSGVQFSTTSRYQLLK